MNIFRKGYFYSVLSIKLIDHLICLLTMYQSTIDGLKEYAIMLNGFPNLTYACIKRLSLKFTKLFIIYEFQRHAAAVNLNRHDFNNYMLQKRFLVVMFRNEIITCPFYLNMNFFGILIILNVFLITAFVSIKTFTKRSNNFKIYEKYSMG